MYNKVWLLYNNYYCNNISCPFWTLHDAHYNNTTTNNNNNENRCNDREGTEMDSFSELRNCEMVYVAIIVVP